MREQLGAEVSDLLAAPFPDWEAALRFLVRLADTAPLLVVIDEAPRLMSSQQDLADLVSAVWENRVRGQPLMLVLTGSAVGVMEQMLGAQGGLHRRASLELRMDPFPAVQARAFLPRLPAADFLTAYAACGGYPLHLMEWDDSAAVDDNLVRCPPGRCGLIEGGQGEAVRLRTQPRLQQHLARVFETACRAHAARLTGEAAFPPDMVVGRWWRDETAEVDVLGMTANHTALLGECRWQTAPVTRRDLTELQRKLAYLPDPSDEVCYAFWTRTGKAAHQLPAAVYSAEDVVP